MTSPLEAPRPSPTEKPSDTLLLKARAELDKSWTAFDEATLREAHKAPMAQLGKLI